MRKIKITALLVVAISVFQGCASTSESGGQAADGTYVVNVTKTNGSDVIESINGQPPESFSGKLVGPIQDFVADVGELYKAGATKFRRLANLKEGESSTFEAVKSGSDINFRAGP